MDPPAGNVNKGSFAGQVVGRLKTSITCERRVVVRTTQPVNTFPDIAACGWHKLSSCDSAQYYMPGSLIVKMANQTARLHGHS